jgi:CDP-paratose 2-epimerase
MKLLIISEAGLVGSENCKLFAEKGWKVISVDNYMEGKLFGAKGSTKQTMMAFLKDYNIEHYELDIRDESIIPLIKRVDAVIHSGTQPSHSKSIKIPMEDFQINAYGALFLLEAWRN